MQKKGLSDIVTTVLILLFAIVAVTVVGGIVLNQINKAGSKIESLAACGDMGIEPVKCIYNEQMASPAVGLLYRRTSGGSDLQIVQIDLLVERADKTIVNRTYVDEGHIPISMQTVWGSLANYITTGAVDANNLPRKFRIAASFKDKSGKIIKCSPFAKEVKCVQSGVMKGDTDPSLATMRVIIINGKADSVTISPNGQGSNYIEGSFQTLVQSGGSLTGRAIVYVTSIDKNNNNGIKDLTLIDSNTDWGVGSADLAVKVR